MSRLFHLPNKLSFRCILVWNCLLRWNGICLLVQLASVTLTVNVVIFTGGKISRKCSQDLSRGDNFHDIAFTSLIKSCGVYFPLGKIFAKKVISRKTGKLPPYKNFHIYSYFQSYYNTTILHEKSSLSNSDPVQTGQNILSQLFRQVTL